MIGFQDFLKNNKTFFTKLNQIINWNIFSTEFSNGSILKLIYVEKVLNKNYIKGNISKKFPILLIV